MLWYLYSISIEKPLMHLIENGRRLSTGLPLLPNLTGAVELSKVDKVIREVSNSIGQSVSKEKEAIANSGNLICSIDEDAVFINVNPYVKELLGYDPDEIIGLSLHEFIDQRSDFNLTRTIGEAIKSGTTYEFQVRLKHRRNYWVDTRWSCLYSPIHGSFFSVVQDIGEEIRIQQLKEDFSRTVSDELRTPLAQLQGSLNAMLRGEKGDVPDSVASVLERSKQNVDRLLLLTNDLLDFQRLSGTQLSLNIAMHDSTSIIKEALDSVSSLASTKEIEVLLPADSVKISCDRMRIVQILANLFSNAIKFSPRGSKVEVKLVKQENRLEVLVIDSGPGIQSKDRERIFQAFEQVSSAHSKEGTGLGLAICKMFVEAHGGTIQASSTSSDTNEIVRFSDGTVAGTVFTISLPL
jgi:PAS domain S-box-containing protein